MRTKRILLLLPLLLGVVLVQSAFWIPSHGSQAAARSGRLSTLVEAKIGDTKFLNPILASDNATAEVINRRIFDRLVDADENLDFRPCLAESWTVTEEAFVGVRPERRLPNGEAVTARTLLTAIEGAIRSGPLKDLAPALRSIDVVPPSERRQKETVLEEQGKAKGKAEAVSVTLLVAQPERVRLLLDRVEPRLFERLEPVLGKGYFEPWDVRDRFRVEPEAARPKIEKRFSELLPVGEHNPSVTFKLRRGVTFHDGHPFSARDVAFTYEALVDSKNASPRAASFDSIDRYQIVDDFTIRFFYKRLYSGALIDWMMGIIPEHLLNREALQREMDARKIPLAARATFSIRNSDFNRRPIGTGPFKFVDWRPEQYVEVRRNDAYWGERPRLERIYTRVIPDKLAQELELRTGAVDVYEAEPHQSQRLRGDDALQVVSRREGFYYYIAYNQRRPKFQDVRVRRALGMALNVDELIRYVLSGEGRRSTGPFYSNTPFNDKSVPPLAYDPARAAELLTEAGYVKNAQGYLEKDGKPFEFTLITNAGNPQRKAILTIAQEYWRRLGIRCNTQVFEWTVFLEQFVYVGNFDAIVLGWVGGDMSPDKYQLWHSSQAGPHKLNYTAYSNAEADALMEEIRIEYDREKQIQLTHALHRRIVEDQPYTFLYEPARPYALPRGLALAAPEPGPDGKPKLSPIQTTPSGEIFYFLSRWVHSDAALSSASP